MSKFQLALLEKSPKNLCFTIKNAHDYVFSIGWAGKKLQLYFSIFSHIMVPRFKKWKKKNCKFFPNFFPDFGILEHFL